VKFTPDGGTIDVSLEARGSRAILSVRDTGRGIEREFLDEVFDRFSQAEGFISRTTGGLGLGLAIVRNIVELHGGEVTAESEGPGKGATFRVLLPISTSRAVTTPPHGAAISRLDGRRILVVDDSPEALNMFASLLGAAGAKVFPASSAREALELTERENIDVVVTDIAMPGESGLSLISALRSRTSARNAGCAIVAMTALGSSMESATLEAGATAFLEKPVSAADLLRVLAEV
jgi:CheY-like chemotaxis protein